MNGCMTIFAKKADKNIEIIRNICYTIMRAKYYLLCLCGRLLWGNVCKVFTRTLAVEKTYGVSHRRLSGRYP